MTEEANLLRVIRAKNNLNGLTHVSFRSIFACDTTVHWRQLVIQRIMERDSGSRCDITGCFIPLAWDAFDGDL